MVQIYLDELLARDISGEQKALQIAGRGSQHVNLGHACDQRSKVESLTVIEVENLQDITEYKSFRPYVCDLTKACLRSLMKKVRSDLSASLPQQA